MITIGKIHFVNYYEPFMAPPDVEDVKYGCVRYTRSVKGDKLERWHKASREWVAVSPNLTKRIAKTHRLGGQKVAFTLHDQYAMVINHINKSTKLADPTQTHRVIKAKKEWLIRLWATFEGDDPLTDGVLAVITDYLNDPSWTKMTN